MPLLVSALSLSGLGLPAIDAGPVTIDLDASARYRYAAISDDAFDEDARASTVRLLLGAETRPVHRLSARVELRSVQTIGPDEFDDGLDGDDAFPPEPDPSATELSQGFVRFASSRLEAWGGRRKPAWEDERFLSDYDWRQNGQSLDGAGLTVRPGWGVELDYAYAFNVNRPLTEDDPEGDYEGAFHSVRAAWTHRPGSTVELLYLSHTFDEGFAETLSATTWGVGWTGEVGLDDGPRVGVKARFARQESTGENPLDFAHNYTRVETYARAAGLRFGVGVEALGGDGTSAFQTPFGDLHSFNGFTDRFLETPDEGLEDLFITAGYSAAPAVTAPWISEIDLEAAFHTFMATERARDYGSEWTASARVDFGARISVEAKAAHYNASGFPTSATGFSTDATKVWAGIRARF